MTTEHWTVAMSRTMKLLREMKGLGLREHARQLDIPSSTLSRIENAKPCDVDTLLKIHKVTGVKVTTLLGL